MPKFISPISRTVVECHLEVNVPGPERADDGGEAEEPDGGDEDVEAALQAERAAEAVLEHGQHVQERGRHSHGLLRVVVLSIIDGLAADGKGLGECDVFAFVRPRFFSPRSPP